MVPDLSKYILRHTWYFDLSKYKLKHTWYFDQYLVIITVGCNKCIELGDTAKKLIGLKQAPIEEYSLERQLLKKGSHELSLVSQ